MIISELKSKDIVTFRDWFELITDRLDHSNAKAALGDILMNRIGYDKNNVISSIDFNSIFTNELNKLMDKGSGEESILDNKIKEIFNLPIKSLLKWVDFIIGIEGNDFVYHTYHGTKGEEYNNVAIILEHGFGVKDKLKFKKYFELKVKDREERNMIFSDVRLEVEYVNTQNLLYVACSRAIKIFVFFILTIYQRSKSLLSLFLADMSFLVLRYYLLTIV